jgi:hypothetical protein
MVGGATNVAMGGNYKDGFYSAALAAEATSYGPFVNTGSAGGVIARTIQASVVGGTVSVIGGGKFVNAAYTTAFQHLLNFELPANADKVKSMQDVARVKSAINESLTTSSSQPVNLCDAELSIIMKRYKYSLQIRNPGFFGWAYDTAGSVDTIFHDQFPTIKFNFINTSNNPILPKSGIYLGSDINYVAVGINFGAANAAQTAVVGNAGHNYVQAIISGGVFTASGRRNMYQIFSAQPWTRAGFSYYKHNE